MTSIFHSKHRLCALLIALVAISSLFFLAKGKISQNHQLLFDNVEALSTQETSTGVEYECTGELCIIFEYRNRFLVSGCKAAENSTCTVKIQDINISL